MEVRNKKQKKIDYFEVFTGFYLLLVLGIILVTAQATDHTIFLVLAGLFPTILTILIALIIHEQFRQGRAFIWILPIIIITAFYIFGQQSQNIFAGLDFEVLSGVNFLLSLVYLIISFAIFKTDLVPVKEIIVKREVEVPVHVEVPIEEKKTIQEYIHSIEDKSKALNFVIGRVYSKFHGGNAQMREKLRIPSEWYNEFSLIGVGSSEIDFEKLDELITRFELQLKQFEKTEFEIFRNDIHSLKNLIREPNGNDRIIDIIDHNDKDPARAYYEGALEFCTKIREEMKNKQVSVVKNSYIPKTEEEKEELEERNTKINSAEKIQVADFRDVSTKSKETEIPEEKIIDTDIDELNTNINPQEESREEEKGPKHP